MQDSSARRMLLAKMDRAFSHYFHEAEKLSVLLAEPADPSSWSLYHNLLRQRSAEGAAYEAYRTIKDQLFTLINPPIPLEKPESSIN